jgi:hypothetical protein
MSGFYRVIHNWIEFALLSLVDDNFITLQVNVSNLENVKSCSPDVGVKALPPGLRLAIKA